MKLEIERKKSEKNCEKVFVEILILFDRIE